MSNSPSWQKGVELTDGITPPAIVKRERDSEKYTFLEITIREGRTCKAANAGSCGQ